MKSEAKLALALILLSGCSGPAGRTAEPKQSDSPKAAKILHFYVSPGEIARGERALLCYGVENARAVRLEPPLKSLAPLQNHCFSIKPERNTECRLIAESSDGSTASEKLTVRVRTSASAPEEATALQMIQVFTASATEIAAGQQVTLCYAVRNAASVSVTPGVQPQYPSGKSCFTAEPRQTTTYTLTASSGGKTEQQQVTVKVR